MGLSEWLKAPPRGGRNLFLFRGPGLGPRGFLGLALCPSTSTPPVRVSPLVLPLPALPGEAMDPNPR